MDLNTLIRLDAQVWWSTHGVIRNKEGKEEKKPRPNIVQLRMFEAYRQCRAEKRPCRIMVLKPRQVGASTAAQAISYHHFRSFSGLNGALMGDIAGTSDKVFEIFRFYAQQDRFDWKDTKRGDLEPNDDITLPNGSHYGKETAGSKNAGRSGTVQLANATEVAFFPRTEGRDPALGFLNSFYDGGEMSLAIFDSTPNGPHGLFYDNWSDKTNGWIKIFAAWFEFEEHTELFASDAARAEFMTGLDDLEREEVLRYGVTAEQLNWRRSTIKNKCQGDPWKFRQEYPSNDVECFLLSSRLCFNATNVDKMTKQAQVSKPGRGEFAFQDSEKVTFRPDESGSIEVWEEPKLGCRYLVSADTCTGEDQQQGGTKADPDYHAIGVLRAGFLDPNTGRVVPPRIVALHWSRLDSDLAAHIARCMSIWYGRCTVVPEVNNCGLVMVKRLQEWGVPVFMREHVNKTANTTEKFAGWKTDGITRKTIIDNLKGFVREWTSMAPTVDIPSLWILEQFAKFVINESGKAEAMPGAHDDGVLMVAIAVYNEPLATEMKLPKRKPVNIDKLNAREGWRGLRR